MRLAHQYMPWMVSVLLVIIGVAQWLREDVTGPTSVALYGLEVAGVVAGIVLVFSWAKEQERLQGVETTRYRFTPWRRRP